MHPVGWRRDSDQSPILEGYQAVEEAVGEERGQLVLELEAQWINFCRHNLPLWPRHHLGDGMAWLPATNAPSLTS